MTDEKMRSLVADYNLTRVETARDLVCHAPFVSMNFDQSGDVTVCCLNRKFVVGRYPEQTLEQIWRSPKTHELREAIRELNWNKGCHKCRDELVSRNFYATLARNYDQVTVGGDEAARTGPRILEFETSNICNLECIMCTGHFSSLIRKNRERLPPIGNPYDAEFVNQLRPFWKTVEWAKFLGGEPFLNPMYFDIWRQIAAENDASDGAADGSLGNSRGSAVKVVITSNATVWNRKVEWVLENVKPFLVLSIDSFKKETYEKIRINSSFEKTQDHLARFIDYAKRAATTVDLAVCPMVQNWQEIPEIFEWGTRNVVCINLNTLVRPEEFSLKFLGAAKIREIVEEYKMVKLKHANDLWSCPLPWNVSVANSNRSRFESFIRQLEFWAAESGAIDHPKAQGN